ncbi:hypothetical protein FH972_024580 [Carpinus fangiana]|uniref:Uncharacterized protein n=1 Tax=Carpinus fangiana TaxID=176857 RepID=A0A5N6KYW0_9ROSI|nr:hypothetical protein FH972_024580 [Carpinus fangiana]
MTRRNSLWPECLGVSLVCSTTSGGVFGLAMTLGPRSGAHGRAQVQQGTGDRWGVDLDDDC